MNRAVALPERLEGVLGTQALRGVRQNQCATVLIATADPQLHHDLTTALQDFPLNIIWVKGVEAVKSALLKQEISACFCGFWLQDGTYRELVRHVRTVKKNVPSILVGGAASSQEYGLYRGITTSGAFDFLCHPYKKTDLAEILSSILSGGTGDQDESQTKQAEPETHSVAIPTLDLQPAKA